MAMLDEIRLQKVFFEKLRGQLGFLGALKARGLTVLRGRLGAAEKFSMHPGCLGHPVAVRWGTTDPDTYYQVLVDQQYAVLKDAAPEYIVDCGANVGYTSAWMLSRWPQAQLIAIEPFPANAQLTRENLAPYGARATVIEAAVWHSQQQLVVDGQFGNEWGVQVHENAGGGAGNVAAISLNDIPFPRIDLLKIDIEGAEEQLFSRNLEWLDRVSTIAIELHGAARREIFLQALSGFLFDLSDSGELTIVRNLRRQ